MRKAVAVISPELLILVDDGGCPNIIDSLKKTAAEDLNGLVISGRIQQRRLASRNAFCLGHPVCNELIFVTIRVASLAIFADRKCVYECSAG